MPSIHLNRTLDRRLRAVAAARDRSRSRCARDAVAAFVTAAEGDVPLKFSYHERLSVMLHSNWLAFPEGHYNRVPPQLILEMANHGDEALIPVLLEDCGPSSMNGLVMFTGDLKYSERDLCLKEITALLNTLRHRQYYGEAPAFTGIHPDQEANRFARYFWLLHRCFDVGHEEHDDIFPGLQWDFDKPHESLDHWRELAGDLPSSDMRSKDDGWDRRRNG